MRQAWYRSSLMVPILDIAKGCEMGLSDQLPDFDVLMALHQKNPEMYEHFRRQVLHGFIARAPALHQPALNRLLAPLEAIRSDATTPLAAAATAFKLMNESFAQLQAPMEMLANELAGVQTDMVLAKFGLQG